MPVTFNSAELTKMLQPHSFSSFLKKHGISPPNTVANEHDEEEILREEIEARKPPLADEYDHEDDISCFDISVVNRKNQALTIDCRVQNGDITFGNVRLSV